MSFSIIPSGKFINAVQSKQVITDSALVSGLLQVKGPGSFQDVVCDNLTSGGSIVASEVVVDKIRFSIGQFTGDHSFNGIGSTTYGVNIFTGSNDSTFTLPTLTIPSNVGISMLFVNKTSKVLTIQPYSGEHVDNQIDKQIQLNTEGARVTLVSLGDGWYEV